MLRCIKFKQKARLKPCINIKTELKKNGKNDFKNCFFMLMNNTVFWITKVNIRNIRGSKVIKTKARIESKYHTTNIYFQIISNRNEMKWTQILTNKLVYLGLSIMGISKMVMYDFLLDYVKPKNGAKINLCILHWYRQLNISYKGKRHLHKQYKRYWIIIW